MARMIPPSPYDDCASDGEVELFERLRADPLARDWTVIHSLCIAKHPRQQWGEADFLVLVPSKGILCIEVKACRQLRIDEGVWYFGKSDAKGSRRGPFRQASEAMHAVRSRLQRQNSPCSGIVFWSAVLFTHCSFALSSPEWEPWQVIDSAAFHDGSIARRLISILDHSRNTVAEKRLPWFKPSAGLPTRQQCDAIAAELRPRYEPLETPADRRRILDRELRRCTDEQSRFLETLVDAPRMIVSGPAGTGKTYLAIAATDRELADRPAPGQRVLVLCFNRLLGDWLRQEMAPLDGRVRVSTMSRLLFDILGLAAAPPGAGTAFWDRLPERAVDALLAGTNEKWLFDTLIVDEAQDLLVPRYRDILDLMLKGGLTEGRWRFFGDFERQSIYEHGPNEVATTTAPLRKISVPLQLRDNCRNPPVIAHLAMALGGLMPPYKRVMRPDDGRTWELQLYENEGQQRDLLCKTLEQYLLKGMSEREITVLSMRKDEDAIARSVTGSWKGRLTPLDRGSTHGIPYASVHRFKGRENRVIVLTDVSDATTGTARDLFYIGVTRAQSSLTLLCHRGVREQLLAAAQKTLGGQP